MIARYNPGRSRRSYDRGAQPRSALGGDPQEVAMDSLAARPGCRFRLISIARPGRDDDVHQASTIAHTPGDPRAAPRQ